MEDRTEYFKDMPKEWRIEAVIHDGSWYDVKKWSKMAKVKAPELEEWIKETMALPNDENYLIQSKVGESYRVSYDEVIRWYDEQEGIEITDKIIPKNYPPRLWDGMTEVEAFLKVPRRDTSTVTFTTEDNEILKKCTVALSGVARVRLDKGGKYRAYGLSDVYMRQVLTKALTPSEMKSLNIKCRKSMAQRELTDFSPEYVEQALEFYIPFARNVLKNHMSTLKIYLNDEGDIDSQIVTWIVMAMRKFDESLPIPFSGYLNSVLRFWPYDLPDEFLGKELSDFQRKRQRAIISLTETHEVATNFSNEEIAKEIGIDIEDYVRLFTQHEVWLSERNATTLNWDDSSNEKVGTSLGDNQKSEHDSKLAHSISLSTLMATLRTNDFESGKTMIQAMDNDNYDMSTLKELPELFKLEFKDSYKEIRSLISYDKEN